MQTESLVKPITYPARPISAGPLDVAPAKDGLWYFEPKVNGWRALVHVPSRQMWNRHGQPLTISDAFSAAMDRLADAGIQWADCEALDRRHSWGRGSLILLDVLDWAGEPYHKRHARIGECLTAASQSCLEPEVIAVHSKRLYFLPAVENRADFRMKLWENCRKANHQIGVELFEGVVAKKGDSTYPLQLISPNREFPFWTKHRWSW